MQLNCKKIEGSNGNWSLDEEGNLHLKGNLVIKGGLDPTYFTCDSQGSDTGVANSLIVVSNSFYFKNSGGTLQHVQLGDATGDPIAGAAADNDTDLSIATSASNYTVESVSAPAGGTHEIVFGGCTWTSDAGENPRFTLGGTILANDVNSGSTSDNSGGFAGILVRTSAAASLQAAKYMTAGITVHGGSVAILKVNT